MEIQGSNKGAGFATFLERGPLPKAARRRCGAAHPPHSFPLICCIPVPAGLEHALCHHDSWKECHVLDGEVVCCATQKLITDEHAEVGRARRQRWQGGGSSGRWAGHYTGSGDVGAVADPDANASIDGVPSGGR